MLNRCRLIALTALAWSCLQAGAQTVFSPSVGEYNWSTAVVQLRMSNIHGRGILGQGVVIALLDTGLNLNNPEFRNNTRVMTGFNATTGDTDVTDSSGHGTHVAGIVGATGNGSGMYGVAPGATLLPIKVFSGGTAPANVVTAGLDYAISHNARVVNLSLGATSPTGDTGLKRVAATNNSVIVIAAGNDSMANPNWPSRYAKESWANGTIIVVGAVDANRKLASFSNRAGDIAPFYLVAPGVNIISSYGSGYGYMNGTSMAAPSVSGAAALITGYWPYLRANQVAAILLNTADDLGAPGMDAIYGRGMLNINRALSPIGSYNYRTVNGTATRIGLNTAGVASSQPKVSTPSAFGQVRTEVFDEYGRNFTSEEGAALAVRSAMTVDSVMGRIDRLWDTAEKVLPGGATAVSLRARTTPLRDASLTLNANDSGDAWNHTLPSSAQFFAYQGTNGWAWSAGDGGLSSLTLGLAGSRWGRELTGLETVLSNPLQAFAPQHRFAAVGMPLGQGWSTRLATLQSKSDNAASGQVRVWELTHLGERHAINVSSGSLAEKGLLGGYSNEALGLNQATQTAGLTASGAYRLAPNWAVAASWSETWTRAPRAHGILVGATDIVSTAFGIGLARSNWQRAGDRWSLSVNAPLSARSGTLQYSVITSVDETGAPSFANQEVNLAPSQREWSLDTRYSRPLLHGAQISGALSLRQNPDHDATASVQWVMGLRVHMPF